MEATNQQTTTNNRAYQEQEQESLFSIQTILRLVILHWEWILLSVVVCLGVCYLYLRYTKPVYSASMKVLVKDGGNKNTRSRMQSAAFDQMGLLDLSDGFDNELEIISSANIAERVVRNLKLYVRYYQEGRVVKSELYKNSPIVVDMDEERLNLLDHPLRLMITTNGKGYHIEGKFDKENPKEVNFRKDVAQLPAQLSTKYGILMLRRQPGEEMVEGPLYVNIYPPTMVARQCVKQLSAKPTSKTTTIANISFVDTDKNRVIDYLNELLVCYNVDANEDKNEVARKTEAFIAERLNIIRNELDTAEGELEEYKRKNELINLTNDATTALSSITNYRKEQVEIQTQISILKSIMDYMDSPANYLAILPVNLGLDNQELNKSISQYNNLILRRNRYLKGSSEDNPTVIQVTQQAQDLWPLIRENMSAIYRDMQTQKRSIDSQFDMYSGQINRTPTQERALTNIGRQQELKSNLYLTLLQKREENYIQLASVAAKARMIDAPMLALKPISPKPLISYAIALVLGLCAPIGVFYLLALLRTRIEGREDIEKLTKLTILADIPKTDRVSEGNRAVVVKENINDSMEESFRALRTNLPFVLKKNEKVIISTSCIPGEGKTFVASNLAMSIALMGKKVILVGLDIRKPRLVQLFGLVPDRRGITNFLALDDPDYALLEQQITHSGIHSNLDVMPAGIIPPNPSELLSGNQLKLAIEHLSTIYDYVILDTPPLALVTDTLNIARVADMTIIVTRADYSLKENFAMVNDLSESGRLPKCSIVLNGVDYSKRKYGHYGHYGHYGRYSRYGNYAPYGDALESQTYTEK